MSLDTVLKIGKALRSAPDSLRHFKYVSPCPTDNDGNYPFCVNIPVSEDFNFDWNGITEVPEIYRDRLYYLRFKTSDSDSLMKYIFGDIYYLTSAKIKKDGLVETSESGGYRLENLNAKPPFDKSSYYRAEQDFEDIIKKVEKEKSNLFKFRNALQKELSIVETILGNISAVECFLKNPSEINFLDFIQNTDLIREYTIRQLKEKISKQNLKKLEIGLEKAELSQEEKDKLLAYDSGEIFVHFDFSGNRHWYDFKEDLEHISKKILADFVDKSEKGLVLKKTLYKTLCSGDKKNDWQFPNFEVTAKHKSKAFSDEAIQDLFYAIDFSKKGKLITGTDIKIIVLPQGENLEADDYVEFQSKRNEEKVKQANSENQIDSGEPLFDIFEEKENFTSFDVIFSKKGGATSPDVDLIEISGLEKSKIQNTRERIREIKQHVSQKRKAYFSNIKKELFDFKIAYSFKEILGSPQSDMKTGKVNIKASAKYQSHILKVLPLIYTDNYYSDDLLISSFIQIVEYSTRSGDPKYNFLKFDLEFLISIQNKQDNKFMNIINSESYQIGKKIGRLAKPLKKAIKSFEKNYVGLLTRRVNSLENCVAFLNEIDTKLTMHGKTWAQTSSEARQMLAALPKEKYDKELLAFGFFEGYFAYEVSDDKKKLVDRLEKLIADYEGKDNFETLLAPVSNVLDELKSETSQ